MLRTILSLIVAFVLGAGATSAQEGQAPTQGRFFASTTFLSLTNVESERTNLHHYEVHFGYALTPRDRVGVKAATWKLFEPMGIPMWNALFREESERYPGRLRESGVGVTYQRLLWKNLFGQIELLPLKKTYLDQDGRKVDDGFKLYTSYHVGYRLQFFDNHLFFEPQVHCNYWPIDSTAPQGFSTVDDRWHNYFLFEPNLYIGVRF